jgi:hypothetical protein
LTSMDLPVETEDERAAREEAVAELIAHLSEMADTPAEFKPPGSSLRPDEIDFATHQWMAALAAVQGWLRLPEPLTLDDPKVFVSTLLRGLGYEEDILGLDADDPRRLSDAGLDRLRQRLELASHLQQTFLEHLEAEGGTVASATGQWVEAWEEEPELEEQSTGPVSAKAETWPINEFTARAIRGRLNLSPSYQRGEVWPIKDSQMLIESILRGIPLPSVIILKPEDVIRRPYEVVDGKQRLTAILRFIGRHPRALECVEEQHNRHPETNFMDMFTRDYARFRMAWKNLVGEQLTASKERDYYFPFKMRRDAPALQGDLAPLAGRYYTDVKDLVIRIADDQVTVQDLFEQVTDYKIPVIEYSKATRRQIHEVFNLYNKQGKHLNAEEIRNALYHDLDFMRGLIVAAGDNENMEEVAGFILPVWPQVSLVPVLLGDYGFGTSRYRRTKVLSWLASILFMDSNVDSGKQLKLQSTTRQIDALLHRIEEDPHDPLRDQSKVRAAFSLMARAIESHSAVDEAWASVFKDTKQGAKWQELQLVASLLGVALAASVLEEDVEEALDEVAAQLRASSASKEWRRPEKTQTATQWAYIAKVALWVLEALGVEPEAVSAALRSSFGSSCMPALLTTTSGHVGSG